VIAGKRICVVMPAYNAARTLEKTTAEIDRTVADDIILVDDASHDETVAIARRLSFTTSYIRRTGGTAGTRRPATRRPSSVARTWSS